MVARQIAARGVDDARVLDAMRAVPRHRFIPADGRDIAYGDHPVPIGHRQTISQPYIVAYMTQALALQPGHKVLEIGTGSGYQAALLAEMAAQVYTIEIVAPLAERARTTLEALGYTNIHYRVGDGYVGWPEAAPFDAIMLTASPPTIPQPLLDQLAIGGVMIAPVGRGDQELVRITRTAQGLDRQRVMGVRFVPMTGRAQDD
jgi:protein-L-isoaspartate(D-aspartate) O-methyltransferase